MGKNPTTPKRKIVKETAKQRKEKEREEPTVLVAFGKHSLKELMDNRHTDKGEYDLMGAADVHHWPPVYRRVSACSVDDVKLFQEYIVWVGEMLGFINPEPEEAPSEEP